MVAKLSNCGRGAGDCALSEMRTKFCPRCRSYRPRRDYHKDRTASSGLGGWCKHCKLTAVRVYRTSARSQRIQMQWRQTHSSYGSDWMRYKKYGLTRSKFDALLKQQSNCCAICKNGFVIPRRHQPKTWVCVDHDHSTGKVRGLLCDSCNQGLHKFLDCPKYLRSAAKYLCRFSLQTT